MTNKDIVTRTRTPLNIADNRRAAEVWLTATKHRMNGMGKVSTFTIQPDGLNIVVDLPNGEFIILDVKGATGYDTPAQSDAHPVLIAALQNIIHAYDNNLDIVLSGAIDQGRAALGTEGGTR